MSKSKGNVVDPWEVLETYGADAFRWYYLTAQQPWSGLPLLGRVARRGNAPVPEHAVEHLLVLGHVRERGGPRARDGAAAPAPGEGTDLDRWILSELERTAEVAGRELESFNCTRAGQELAAFVETLSNRYVRLSRRRFWEGDADALGTLRHCLLEVVAHARARSCRSSPTRSIATSPATASSVHLSDFPRADGGYRDPELEAGVAAAMRAIELGRAARAAAKMKMRQPLSKAVIVATGAERDEIERLGDIVRSELNVRELEFVTEEAELVSHRVKPNYRTLGPRFGKSMPQVAAAVEGLDPDSARAAANGERAGRHLDRRPRAHARARRPPARDGAARGLRGRVGGRESRGAGARPGRRPAPRGAGSRGRPRRAERAQAGRARDHRSHRAPPGRRRRADRGRPRPRGVRDGRGARDPGRIRGDGPAAEVRIEGKTLSIGVARA